MAHELTDWIECLDCFGTGGQGPGGRGRCGPCGGKGERLVPRRCEAVEAPFYLSKVPADVVSPR